MGTDTSGQAPTWGIKSLYRCEPHVCKFSVLHLLHFAFDIPADQLDNYKQKLQDLGLEVMEHSWGEDWNSIYFFDFDGHQGEFITGGWD